MSLLKNKLFYLCVVIPTLIALLYYGLFASDVYTSESRFIVRSAGNQSASASALGSFLQDTGFSSSTSDAYSVENYILSRSAMGVLIKDLSIKEKFSNNNIDAFSRFAGIFPDESNEAFYRYYGNMVTVDLEPASSIMILQTKAFQAEDSFRMNETLVDLSEQLINRLNERARQDTIQYSQTEVDKSEEKAKAAAIELANYQNKEGVLDPEKESAIPLQQVAKLQDNLLATRGQILQIEALAPDNPQLPVLRKQVKMLEKEIDKESAKITTSSAASDQSLASKAVQFQRLSLDKEFAERQLGSALASLEQARMEAQKKQLYLELISQASLPDEATEPHRIRTILTVFILGLILWGVLSLLVTGAKEHHG